MIGSEREKLLQYQGEWLSIGITADGKPVGIGIPWSRMGIALNMRTPNVFLMENDLYDPEISGLLERHIVVGLYVLTPLRDYSPLSRFTRVQDLFICKGGALRDLSFARGMTDWIMVYLEDAQLENLDDLFCQDREFPMHQYALGLRNCKVADLSSASAGPVKLTELEVWSVGSRKDREKWSVIPAITYQYGKAE